MNIFFGIGTANTASVSCVFIIALNLVSMALRMDANTLHTRGSVATKELSDVDSSSGTFLVNITVLNNAVSKGAVCLDGSPPAYHLHRGFGSGADSWLVHMEGGGLCNDIPSCSERANSSLGSSLYMGKAIAFSGILSDQRSQNPDFSNWNRVMVRYCDGSAFTGDVEEVDAVSKLHFRGQRIWQAVMEDLLAEGMHKAEQALLTGCSVGGLSAFFYCDDFHNLLHRSAKVKCMPDAGFFIDLKDVSGVYQLRTLYQEVITLHGSLKNLPVACTSKMDPASLCYFPQYLLRLIKTPLLVVSAGYDPFQIRFVLVPTSADPNNYWHECKMNIKNCTQWQLKRMEALRKKMLRALKPVSKSTTGGLFINSCYAHCQTNVQDLWHSPSSPRLNSKTIAEAAGDWFFSRSAVKYIDCPYLCDSTCPNLVWKD
jgi:hypothetical protein